LFDKQIKQIQGSSSKTYLVGSIHSYLFLIIAINYFIIVPNKSVEDAFILGVVIYGVFEYTNYAIFKKWSELFVITDTIWGGLLFAITTYITNQFRKIQTY
jgi:uncharacterized membrane protein